MTSRIHRKVEAVDEISRATGRAIRSVQIPPEAFAAGVAEAGLHPQSGELMMNDLRDILTFTAVLGSGLVAGIFFAFSSFVMRALAELPRNQGIAAMKAINVTVLNPWFFLAFFGTGAVCLPVAFLAIGSTAGTHRAYLLAACALYLLGCLLVTVACNVPLNNRLAATEPDDSGVEALWAHYLSRWTLWNHVRTAASLAAAGLFAKALCGGLLGG